MKRLYGATLALFLGSIFVTDCTRATPPPQAPPFPLPAPWAQAPLADPRAFAPSPGAPPPSAANAEAAERVGDPNVRELVQTRLVASTCETVHRTVRELVEHRVAQMREEIDAAWNDWKKSPDCREAFGAGGLGLSGIGEGGGGYGEGIGLGSIGTIGHGAGVSGGRYSGTNNQVDGVEEADMVKTDGRYLYLAVNGALRIVDAKHPRVCLLYTSDAADE